jgi:hypothetical protein
MLYSHYQWKLLNYSMVWHSQDTTLMIHLLSATSKWKFFVYICDIQICGEYFKGLSKYICVAVAKELPIIAEYSFHTLILLQSITESLLNQRFLLQQSVFLSNELNDPSQLSQTAQTHCNIFVESTWIGSVFCGFKVVLIATLIFHPSWSLIP